MSAVIVGLHTLTLETSSPLGSRRSFSFSAISSMCFKILMNFKHQAVRPTNEKLL